MFDYFKNILVAITTILKALKVTFFQFFREPITIQYPDRLKENTKVVHMLPIRSRGFLKVDIESCTGCLACQRACPCFCIKIDIEKNGTERSLKGFIIDEGKCMYCGLCVEPCPTNAIYFTKEFEKATYNIDELVFPHVDIKKPVYKFRSRGNS